MTALIHDWNATPPPNPRRRVMLDDETLRDGLQSTSVRTPSIDEKLEILHLMESMGIDAADIGLPGAGPHVAGDVERLAREIIDHRLRIRPNAAARTMVADIRPIAEISQRVGRPIEVAAFIGSSHIRQYAEGWTVDFLERTTVEAISFATREGLPVLYVTEDTTRAHPEALRRLYLAALRAGATRLCIADTVGHATPPGVTNLVRFVQGLIDESGCEAEIDWHGHQDRGLAIANTLAAIDAGATRVHATALGIGERCGNTQMDVLLVNLVLQGYLERDLTKLDEYCALVSRACEVEIPRNYPVVGYDAFRTQTGVHASAIVKAYQKHDDALADAVYSAIPAAMVGRRQEIEVGPMSGKSNVVFWLTSRGLPADDDAVVDRILQKAKRASAVLREDEILAEIRSS